MGLVIKVTGAHTHVSGQIQNHVAFWKEYQKGAWDKGMSEAAQKEVFEAARQSLAKAFYDFFTDNAEARKLERAEVGIPEGDNGNHILPVNDAIHYSEVLANLFDVFLEGGTVTGWPSFYSEWSGSPDFVINWRSTFAGATAGYQTEGQLASNTFDYSSEINLNVVNFRNALTNLFKSPTDIESLEEDAPTPPTPSQVPWYPRFVPSHSPVSLPTGQSIAASLDKMNGYNWAKRLDDCTPAMASLHTYATYYSGLPKGDIGPYIKGERWSSKLDQIPLPEPLKAGSLSVSRTRELQLNFYGYEKVKANFNISLPSATLTLSGESEPRSVSLWELPLPTKPQWGLNGWNLRLLQIRVWPWKYLAVDPELEVPDPSKKEDFWCTKIEVSSPTSNYTVARAQGVQRILEFFRKDGYPADLSTLETIVEKINLEDSLSTNSNLLAPITNIIAHVPGTFSSSNAPGPNGVYRSARNGKYYILVASARRFIDSLPFVNEVNLAFRGEESKKLNDYDTICAQNGGCYEAFFDLNAYSFAAAMQNVANVLKRYHKRVESFEGTAETIDLNHEAKQLENLSGLLNDFLKYPGQGYKIEGFPAGIKTKNSWLALGSTKNDMHLAQVLFGSDNTALFKCHVGIECLKKNISPRTMHFASLYKEIIQYDSKKKKNTDTWQEFLGLFVYPKVKIFPSGKVSPSEDEKEKKELKVLDKKSVLTSTEKLRQAELHARPWHERKRAASLRERLTVRDSNNDPIFEPAFLESQEWKDFEEIYIKLFNRVDMQNVWAQILKCLSNLAGIPLTGEALCEYLFREILQAIGIDEMRKLLSVNAGLAMGIVDGLSTSAFGGTPEEVFRGEANSTGVIQQGLQDMSQISAQASSALVDQGALASSELAADSTGAIANLGYEEYAAGGTADQTGNVDEASGNVSQFMSNISVATDDIDTFIDELKQFLDFKKVCRDITQYVLDLPGDFLEDPSGVISDFTTPEGSFDWEFLADFVPDLPNPPKFNFPEIGKSTDENGDIMDVYEDALWKVTAGIVSGLVDGAMSELMNACLTEEGPGPNVGPGEYGAFENQLPAFANVSAPSPALSEAFDVYNLSPDNSAKFMKNIAKMLTGREMCNLFRGISPQSILLLIRAMLEKDFQEYLPELSTLPDIRMFFIHVGTFIDLKVCNEFEESIPYVSELCEDFDSLAGKRKALQKHGFSDQEIESQLKNELSENLNKIKDLMGLIRQDPSNLLKDKIPTFKCEDLVPGGILPSVARANKIVLDTMFGVIKTIFEKEAESFKAIISPDPAREATAAAEMADILGGLDEYVGSNYDVKSYGRKPDGTLRSPLDDGSTIMPGRGRLVTHMVSPDSWVFMGHPWHDSIDVIMDKDPDPYELANKWDDPAENYYDGDLLYENTPAVILDEDEWWERWKKGWPRGRNGFRHRFNNNVAVRLKKTAMWHITKTDHTFNGDGPFNIQSGKNNKTLLDFAYELNMKILFGFFREHGQGHYPNPHPDAQFGSENYLLGEEIASQTIFYSDVEFPEDFGNFDVDHELTVENFKIFVNSFVGYPRQAPDNDSDYANGLYRYSALGGDIVDWTHTGQEETDGGKAKSNRRRRARSSTLIPYQDFKDAGLAFQMPSQDLASLMDSQPKIRPFQRLRDTLSNPSNVFSEQVYARTLVNGHYVPITGEEEIWTEGYWEQPAEGEPPSWVEASYKKPAEWVPPAYHYDAENVGTKHVFKVPKELAQQQALSVLGNSSFSPAGNPNGALANRANNIGADVYSAIGEYDPKAERALRGVVAMAITGKPDETSGDVGERQKKTVGKIMNRLTNSDLTVEYELVRSDLPDNSRHDDIFRVKVVNGGMPLVNQLDRVPYPPYLESMMEATGISPGEYPKTIAELFGMLVVAQLKNKIPGASPRSITSPRDFTFPGESADEIKEVFEKFVHPKETNRIINQMRKRTLHSPFFDVRFVDKFLKKLFLNAYSEICEFEGGTVSEKLLGLEPLREQVDGRLREILCRQPFKISDEDEKLAKIDSTYLQLVADSKDEGLGLEAIEEATLDGLIQIRLRLSALQIMFEFMPVASVFNTSQVLLKDYFKKLAIERVKNQMMQESEVYHDLIISRCGSILMDELEAGSGVTEHPNKSYHQHSYEVDINGDGWAVEIVTPGHDPEGYGRAHRHRIKNYIVHNPRYTEEVEKNYNHVHLLSMQHHRMPGTDALEIIFSRQYNIIVGTISDLMDELGYSSSRIKSVDDYADKVAITHYSTGINSYQLYTPYQPSYFKDGVEQKTEGSAKETGQLFINMDDPDGKLVAHAGGADVNKKASKVAGALTSTSQLAGRSYYSLQSEQELFAHGGFVLQPYLYVQHKNKLGKIHEAGQNTKIYEVAFNKEYPEPDPLSANITGFDEVQIENSDPFVKYFNDKNRPYEKLNEYGASSIDFWSEVLQLIGGPFDYLFTTYAETPIGYNRPLGWNYSTLAMDGSYGHLPGDSEDWPEVAERIDAMFDNIYKFDCMRPGHGCFTYKSEKNSIGLEQLTDAHPTSRADWFNNTFSGISTPENPTDYNSKMLQRLIDLPVGTQGRLYAEQCRHAIQAGIPCSSGDALAASLGINGLPFAPQETIETSGLENLLGFREKDFPIATPNGKNAYAAYDAYEKDPSTKNVTYSIGTDENGNVSDIYLAEDGTGNIQGYDRGNFPVQNPNYTGKITWQSIYKQYLRALKAYRIKFLKEEKISYGDVVKTIQPGLSLDGITMGGLNVGAASSWFSPTGLLGVADPAYVQKITKIENKALAAAFDYIAPLVNLFSVVKGIKIAKHNAMLDDDGEVSKGQSLHEDIAPETVDLSDEYADFSVHDQVIVRPKNATTPFFINKNIRLRTSDPSNIGWQDVIDIANYFMVESDYTRNMLKRAGVSQWMYAEHWKGTVYPRLYLEYGQGNTAAPALHDAYNSSGVPDWQKIIDYETSQAGQPLPDPGHDFAQDVGSSLTFWSGHYETVTYPAKQSVDAITLQYFADYFDCMKYGLRLLYVPPSKPYGKWPQGANIEENENIVSKLDEAFDNLADRINQNNIDGKANSSLKTLSDAYVAAKAFDITEHMPNPESMVDTDLSVESYSKNNWRMHPIPLADVRVNIETIYCTAGPLEFSAFKPTASGGRHSLAAGYDKAFPTLVSKLQSTPQYKLLFDHIFPYNRLLSLVCLHSGLSNQDVRMENRFRATRETILDFIMSTIDQQELPFSMQPYGSLTNYKTATSSTSTNAADTPWADIAMKMLYTAPRMILKGVVTLTDPCVSTAITINDLVMTIVQTSIMIAEEVRDGVVASMNLIITELENQIAELEQQIELADSAVTIAELAVTTAKAASPPNEAFIAQLEQDLESAKSYVDTVNATIGTASGALADARTAIGVAEEEVTDVIDTVKGVVEAISPYLVPGISFAQMPSMIPFGFLFPPPPFGPGVGPPMTSFGFIYCLLLIIEGLVDDFDIKKQDLVDEYSNEDSETVCNVSPF